MRKDFMYYLLVTEDSTGYYEKTTNYKSLLERCKELKEDGEHGRLLAVYYTPKTDTYEDFIVKSF